MSGAKVAVFVASEIAAGVAAIAVQVNQGAPTKDAIIGAAAVVVALGVLWGVVRFFLKPLLHNWFFAVMDSEPARTTETIVDAFDKNDRTRAMTRGFIDRLYADKIANDQETRDIAETNRDDLVFLKESNARQGEAITRELARAMEHMAKSTDRQTGIMEKIQQELENHAVIIARLDERVQRWDGRERRQDPR